METNEIKVTEGIVESAEEIVTKSSGKTLQKLGIVGAIVGATALAYFGVKKLKAKKAQEVMMEAEEAVVNPVDDDIENSEEA